MNSYTAWHALTGEHDCAPAQEEKEMENMPSTPIDAVEAARECREYNLRERWDRAFFAALTGLCAGGEFGVRPTVEHAIGVANETIRRNADMMAVRDAIIAEVVG